MPAAAPGEARAAARAYPEPAITAVAAAFGASEAPNLFYWEGSPEGPDPTRYCFSYRANPEHVPSDVTTPAFQPARTVEFPQASCVGVTRRRTFSLSVSASIGATIEACMQEEVDSGLGYEAVPDGLACTNTRYFANRQPLHLTDVRFSAPDALNPFAPRFPARPVITRGSGITFAVVVAGDAAPLPTSDVVMCTPAAGSACSATSAPETYVADPICVRTATAPNSTWVCPVAASADAALIERCVRPTDASVADAPPDLTKPPGSAPVGVPFQLQPGRCVAIAIDRGPPELTPVTQKPAAPVAGFDVAFSTTVSDVVGIASPLSWTFGDGGTGSGNAVTHTYPRAGRYTVRVTATDRFGKTSATELAVVVRNALRFAPPARLSAQALAGVLPLAITSRVHDLLTITLVRGSTVVVKREAFVSRAGEQTYRLTVGRRRLVPGHYRVLVSAKFWISGVDNVKTPRSAERAITITR